MREELNSLHLNSSWGSATQIAAETQSRSVELASNGS